MQNKQIIKNCVMGAVLTLSVMSVGCSITDVTSTTSGAVDAVTPDITLNRFVDVRLASIQKEAAQGKGENLDALADLMGKKDKKAFSSWVHANYDELFSNLKKPSQLITRIEQQGANLI